MKRACFVINTVLAETTCLEEEQGWGMGERKLNNVFVVYLFDFTKYQLITISWLINERRSAGNLCNWNRLKRIYQLFNETEAISFFLELNLNNLSAALPRK